MGRSWITLILFAAVVVSAITLLWEQPAKVRPTHTQQADAQTTRPELESLKFPNAVMILGNTKGRTVIPLAQTSEGQITHTYRSREGIEETLDVVRWKLLETNEDGDRYGISLTIPGTHEGLSKFEKEPLFRGSHITLYSKEQVDVELALKEDAR